MIQNKFLRWIFLAFIAIPLLIWFMVKPFRLVAPNLIGLQCVNNEICLDDPIRYDEARLLRENAISFINQSILPFDNPPRVVFCSTDECAVSFGLGKRSAVTLGTLGTIIGPRAWKDYYLRHEFIHQQQVQRLGIIHVLLMPEWFVEGMAYSLSKDPRIQLLEPWQSDRSKFNQQFSSMTTSEIWQHATNL